VPLSGTGIPSGSFALTVNGSSSATMSVVSGTPASYALQVTPVGGFAGAIALTCAPLSTPEYASCSLNPPSVTIVVNPQNGVATINTITSASGPTQAGTLIAPAPPTGLLLCLLVPGFALLRRWRRSGTASGLLAAMLCALLMWTSVGCGGNIGDPNVRYTPAGTYQYLVRASSTSGIPISQSVTLTVVVTPRI
jgi:hypothetical protein